MDVECQLYAFFCAILYKGFEHPGVLVSEEVEWVGLWGLGGVLEQSQCSQKLYSDFQLGVGWEVSAPTPCVVLFKDQLYMSCAYACMF